MRQNKLIIFLYFRIEDEVTDARIRIESPIFSNSTLLTTTITATPKTPSSNFQEKDTKTLQFFAFDSAKLFPSENVDSWQVTSPVVGIRIKNNAEERTSAMPFFLSNTSIYVTLRTAIYSHNVEPGVWQPHFNSENRKEKLPRWQTSSCQIIRFINSLIVFKCNTIGHYGLLQDIVSSMDGSNRMLIKGAKFKFSPPGVYLGSFVCCFFLMASIATWGIHYDKIATTSKNKHSFINTWVALLFLVALFTVGVYQTDAPTACRIIGVILHYLTTCVLLWLLVSLTNLYKRVNKVLRPSLPTSPEDPSSEIASPPPPKPMLRFYLVGWGIALILCGISAAVNLPHHATYSYCFLDWTPSLAAFYAPSAALVIILVTFFLLTQCILRSCNHVNGYSEATAGNTETTELELLDTASPMSDANPPLMTDANPPQPSRPYAAVNDEDDELSLASSNISLNDAQYSPITQLRAHAVTLILFLLTWASAAITTASPFENSIPFHAVIFSIIYAICASSLGLFIFIYFCVSRTDAVEAWKSFITSCFYSNSKEDETQQLTVANNVTNSSYLSPPDSSQTPPPNNSLLSPPTTSMSSCMAPSVHSIESAHTNKSSSFTRSALPLPPPRCRN